MTLRWRRRRIRSVCFFPERKRQFAEPPRHAVRLNVREVLTVHARCALVGAALGVGMRQDVQARAKRTAVGSRASARRCCKSAFGTRTAFEDCCSARGSPTIIRCTRTAGNVWKNCGPETDARCQLTSSRRELYIAGARSHGRCQSARRRAQPKRTPVYRGTPPHP